MSRIKPAKSMLSNQRARPPSAALAILLIALVPLRAGEIDWDAVRAELELGPPLRWENVTPAGRWAGGVRPRYRLAKGCHTIPLERGESTIALVLPGEHLAVYRWGDTLDPKQWEVSVSDGSGLFLKVDWSPRSRPDRLLLEARGWQARFVRISRPPGRPSEVAQGKTIREASSPEELGLFVLSREPLPAVWPFARELRPERTSVSVRREGEAVGETFFLAGGGRSVTLPAEGARRLHIVTRLLYPETESRLSQRYRVVLEIGDRASRHAQTADIETNAEFLRRVFVDGRESVVGEERPVIFDVPPGATEARLSGDLPFYFRALAENDGVYLLPRLNAPLSIEEARARRESELTGKSGDLLSKLTPGWIERKSERPWDDLERAAKRMALRNDLLDAPLRARRALEAVARAFGDSSSIWRSAADLDDRGRVFIDIYPRDGTPRSATDGRASHSHAFFALAQPTGRDRERLTVGEQHAADLLGRVGFGAFSSLAPARPLRYDLPRSASPGRLRIVFLRDTEASIRRTIRVYFRAGSGDGEAERTLVLAPGDKPHRLLRPSLGAVGLGLLRDASDRLLGAPGVAAWRRGGAPLAPADGIEIDVPQGIRSVELRAEEGSESDASPPSARPLRVAVEARITSSRGLTEMEYAGAARRVDMGLGVERWFRECLRRRARAGAETSPAEFLLWSHWTPILRRLEEHARSFRGGTKEYELQRKPEDSSGSQELVTRPTPADVDHLLEEAAAAESRGRLLLALELWGQGGRAARAQGHSDWAVADLARARILRELGEVYLAEAVLREVLASDALHAHWREALEDLASIYREGSEDFALERLYGYAVLERPGRDTFAELARTLREVGEADEALAVALALERRHRPLEPLLAGSLHSQWRATFERTLQTLADDSARAWWRGQERLARGQFDEARSAFARAGARGGPWAHALEEARAIREELASNDLASRARALLRWEKWMTTLPGPRLWETDEGLVREHDGVMRVESIVSGRGATYFRSAPGRTVRIEVLGPAHLEIEGRPLHRPGDDIVDGWLRIVEGEWMRPLPIAENRPSPGLTIVGRPSLRAGTSVEARLHLGPGLHELEIKTSLPLLVRPRVERPEFPPAALPPLTISTARAGIAGRLFALPDVETKVRPSGEGAGALRVLPPDSGAAPSTTRPARPTGAALFETSPLDLRSLDPALALRVGMRLGLGGGSTRLPEAARMSEPWRASHLSNEEKLWLVRRAGKLGEAVRHPKKYDLEDIPVEILEGVHLSRGEIDRFLELPLNRTPQALEQRFADLVFIAENITAHAKQAVCEGEWLYRNHAVNRRVRSLYTRLVRDFTWSRLLEVEGGGIRRVPIEGWAPESETMRIRRGFLSELEAHEQLLAGERRLVLRLPGERSRVLRIELALAELEIVEPRPVEVCYQIVPEEPGHLWLTKDSASTTVDLALPAGEREVKVWIRAPEPYRYVKTGFVEIRPDEDAVDTLVPLVETTRREYFVATREQPVVFEIDGPAWLRIDELRDGTTESSYRLVRTRERISLLPRGEKPSLFRVFERVESSERIRTRNPEPSRSIDPLPRVPGPLPDAGSIHVAPLGDDTWDGSLRSETWSLGVRALRRRPLEEDLEGRPKPDEFLELGVTHRFHADSLSTHFRTKLLGRAHADGGPGFALEERIRIEPPGWRGIAFHLRGETHTQWPAGSTVEPEGSLEWSAGARARVSQVRKIREGLAHMPSAEVFGRTFSIDEETPEAALVTDQDVFTVYKNRHRAGLRLAETLFYEPWLDTRVSARISLTTNESFDPVAPDHASFRAGIRQMIAGFEVGGDFRLTHYFDDADRSDSVRRHLIGVSAARDFWLAPSRRLEIAGRYTFDIERSDSSFFIQVVLHLGSGRSGYRDFAPGNPSFRGLSRRFMFRALED